MAGNFQYAGSGTGLMKIANIIFGLISLGCIAATFDPYEIVETYFFGAVTACFLVSLIYLLVHLSSLSIAQNFINQGVDMAYHFLGAAMLIVGASLFLQLIVTFNQKYCDNIPVDPNPAICGSKYHTKISAGAFGLISGVFYLITVGLVGYDFAYGADEDEEPPVGYRRPVAQQTNK